MSGKCWICEKWYESEHCPECGPPMPLGPTAEELARHPLYCERCEHRYAMNGSDFCEECATTLAEQAWERQQEEGFRGGEAAAYNAEQQAWIQRSLK